jgi:hypothetical protein
LKESRCSGEVVTQTSGLYVDDDGVYYSEHLTVFGYRVSEFEEDDKEIWKRFFYGHVFWNFLIMNAYLFIVNIFTCFLAVCSKKGRAGLYNE